MHNLKGYARCLRLVVHMTVGNMCISDCSGRVMVKNSKRLESCCKEEQSPASQSSCSAWDESRWFARLLVNMLVQLVSLLEVGKQQPLK